MIISTKIWKSRNYRGFILLFVHPANIKDIKKMGYAAKNVAYPILLVYRF